MQTTEGTGALSRGSLHERQPGGPRQRRWAPKVRTGCMTCRARHIKCDEASPICQQCHRSSRQCVRPLVGAPARPLNTTAFIPTAIELSLNHFFRDILVRVGIDEFSGDLHRRQLPQATHNLLPVWHASNAVAASWWLHGGIAKPADDYAARLKREFITQELEATKHILRITQLRTLSAEQQTEILLANILLVIQLRPHENVNRLLSIQATSLQLIRCWRFWESIDSTPVSALATQVLYHWVKSTRDRRECLLTTLHQPGDNWHEAIAWLQKRSLSTPIRAWIEIDMIWASMRSLLEGLSFQPNKKEIEAALSMRRTLDQYFIRWRARFDALLVHTSAQDSIQFTALHARRMMTAILFKVDLANFEGLWDETCWDDLTSDFAAALSYIISAQDGPRNWYGQEVQVTASIWNSLHFIARFCRDSILRRTALITMLAAMLAALGTLPGDIGDEEKKRRTSNFLIDYIIAHEENAWSHCRETPACRRGEFICNLHRVAVVRGQELSESRYEFTCLTVGDVLQAEAGQKWICSAPISGCDYYHACLDYWCV
ncbi:hypothetical protein BB8028_0003g01350 [Beauveria bassiana]|uniref:Zn(2)-C6 fungal-type domain-containing protein n=1 Tax=Beauveria bassiana TaxID=176275 RepID=A0A2S7Y5U9_BEABA|nr:hypothetical protein BB8028_0003g01350 [Beauveria bassiana]